MDKQLERFPGILTVGGLVFFFVGLTMSALLPLIGIMGNDQDQVSVETLAANYEGSGFEEMANVVNEDGEKIFPEFAKYWEEGATPANYEDALKKGRIVYVENACYQCHTQQVRQFPFETDRYGSASTLSEQNNDLMKPALLGNWRIGPDLARTSGRHDSEWYLQYFWDPVLLHGEDTIMPSYQWLYEEEGELNEDGLALIAYLQWLGDYQPAAVSDESEEE